MLKKNDGLTVREMAASIGKSEKTMSRAIKRPKEKDYIRRVGSDNSGYWELLKTRADE